MPMRQQLLLLLLLLLVAVGGRVAAQFVVEDVTIGTESDALAAKVLRNTETGEELTVVVESGGRTESLRLESKQRPGHLRDVLVSHDDNATAIRLNQRWAGCPLLPFANRINKGKYVFESEPHQLPLNEIVPGVREDALHGFLCNQTLSVVSSSGGKAAHLTLAFNFTDGKLTPGWPFSIAVSIDYELSTSGMRITTHATNTMERRALPFYHSWHPYIRVQDVSRAIIEFDNCTGWLSVDMPPGAPRFGSLIPTGTTTPWAQFDGRAPIGGNSTVPTYYDNEFKAAAGVGQCGGMRQRVHDPLLADTIVLWGDPQYRVFQVFTGCAQGWGWQAVAIEPMSALADAYNNHDGLSVLSAGETFQGSFGIFLE